MGENKPKLLLVDGQWTVPGQPPADAARVAEALSSQFEVVRSDSSDALAILRDQAIAAILAPSGEFLPLNRALAQVQSHAVLNALGEGVCLADSEGQILWSNIDFSQYSPQTQARISAVCRQAAKAVLGAADSGESVASATGASSGSSGGRDTRRRFDIAGEGDVRFFEVLVSPVDSSSVSGGVLAGRVVAVVRDVTTLRRTQQKMAAIDRAGSELVRIDAEVVRKLRTTERLRVLEQKIVKFAHDLLNFDHFAIRLLEDRSGKLELVMSHGLPPEAMEVELYARREGNGISGYVASSGRSYICTDTSTDALYVVGAVSARSSLTVPLRLSDKVIGIFNVESTQPNAFSEEDRTFAEMFSTHVALALHILDLLVVERCATGQAVTGNVEGELSEPLEDIRAVAAKLKEALSKGGGAGVGGTGGGGAGTGLDASTTKQLERILADVDAIKRRMKDVASGPGTILGAEKALTDAALDPAVAGRRVLVADDDPRIRQTVRQLLVALGAEVVACENGTEAIAALSGVFPSGSVSTSAGPGQERGGGDTPSPSTPQPAQHTHFDLLISDIKMPDKTGYEIFAAARKTLPGLPVILMTGFGYDPHHSIVRASEEGLQCVLFKPFQAERLIEEVHKAMARPAK
ncbi:MAG: GAF domain-containing protein [Phycisphaerales bacterium]|nr:GAF domain-containing protein [Phycisphaerales bacterium]